MNEKSAGLTGSDMELHATGCFTIPTAMGRIWTPEQVVAEARSWVRTPYRKNGRVKGAGIDCGTLLLCVFIAAGFVSEEDVKIFNELCPLHQDWWCHTTEERYFKLIIRHACHVLTGISYPTLKARPGCIVVTRHSESSPRWNHGGIVTEWPKLVHAVTPYAREVDATKNEMWNYREVVVFDPWEKLAREGKQ